MMEYSYNIYISNHFILMYTTKSVGSVRLFISYINFEKKNHIRKGTGTTNSIMLSPFVEIIYNSCLFCFLSVYHLSRLHRASIRS